MTLRAEAPSFVMPPPGLGSLCGGPEPTPAWSSPCSTAIPSPTVCASSPEFGISSPWLQPFELGRPYFLSDQSEDLGPLYLPESAFNEGDQDQFCKSEFALVEPAFAEPELNLAEPDVRFSSDFEFKLAGMEDLQNSVANLLANFVASPSTDAGSISSLLFSDGEDSSRPSTPENQEAVLSEAAPKKGWGQSAAKEEQFEEARQTSVMVQNVPRKCTRDLFAKMLDEAGFCGDYDLVYVTADLKQRNCGSGSALLNFRSEEACALFTEAFHKTGVAVAFPTFTGKKAIEVVPAPIQGLGANVRKLEKSGVLMSMLAERPGWRPARYNDAGELEAEIGDC